MELARAGEDGGVGHGVGGVGGADGGGHVADVAKVHVGADGDLETVEEDFGVGESVSRELPCQSGVSQGRGRDDKRRTLFSNASHPFLVISTAK